MTEADAMQVVSPSAAASDVAPPEIGTRAIATFFRYFERELGRERLLRAVKRIGGEPTLEYVLDPENFVSLDYLLRAARVLTEEAEDPLFLRRAGEHQLDDPRTLGFPFYVVRSLGSPRHYYQIAVRNSRTFNRVGEASIEEISNNRVVIRYRSTKPEGNRAICEGRIGQLAAAPRLWGMPLADARELECQVLGAPACRYEFRWTPRFRPLLRGAAGGAAFAVVGAFAAGQVGALVFAALGALATLAVSYRALAEERGRHVLDSAEASFRSMHELHRRFEEVQKLQSALVQAQKLEAVARLSGGIAHDFNNLLTVILTAADVAKRRLGIAAEASVHLDAVSDAARRAAELTRRLLTFARREIAEPRVIAVGERLRALEPMLRGLVGEDVLLELHIEAGPLNAIVDPTQLEQVLMNLAANARDAMPKGGSLRFEARGATLAGGDPALVDSLEPGDYVALVVSDTGSGMDEATRERAFDPFFTTKGEGKGTGLGLATCHGIVRQAGGSIVLDSAPGRGTTVRVHLPRVFDAPKPSESVTSRKPAPRGSETILLAEDDERVRRVIVSALAEAGYRVIEAPGGDEALAAAAKETIHLLITDVIMPGMDGRALAERLVAGRPTMRVLYVSGYSNEIISSRGVLSEGIHLLRKPFVPHDLLEKVRSVLDYQVAENAAC